MTQPHEALDTALEDPHQRPVFPKGWQAVITVICVVLAIFHVYTAYMGPFYAITQRALHVGLSAAIIFLAFPFGRSRNTLNLAINGIAAVIVLAITAYVIYHRYRILRELGYADPTQTDTLLGAVMVLLLLEASRRVIGWEFTAVTVVTMAYGMLGPWLPGILEHQGFSLRTTINMSFVNPAGIYGGLTAVSATTIAVYVLFGAILIATGGGSAFINIALVLAGRIRGGAAQVGVISSGIMGMINGSAVANVATVGSMTIPLMKRQGYHPHFAAGVESAASSGGQIMPPIMGAGAFVMAEILGIPYLQIAVMAIIPAVLYYAVISINIYFEARRLDLQAMPADQIPRLGSMKKELVCFAVPLITLVTFLGLLYTPRHSGFWAIAACILVFLPVRLLWDRDGTIGSRSKDAMKSIVNGCVEGARTLAVIGVLVAVSQIIVAILGLTGVGVKASELIFSLLQANLFVGFLMAAVICLILGLGLPTVPSYIITAAVVGPALQKLGIEPIVAHMFCFYYACMSGLTPPVAGTSFVAAGLAGAGVWKTSWESLRLAMAGFLVPFIFAFHPEILGLGTPMQVVWATVFGLIGCTFFAAAFSRFWIVSFNFWQQALMVVAGVLAFIPTAMTQLLGLLLGVVVMGISWLWRAKPRKAMA